MNLDNYVCNKVNIQDLNICREESILVLNTIADLFKDSVIIFMDFDCKYNLPRLGFVCDVYPRVILSQYEYIIRSIMNKELGACAIQTKGYAGVSLQRLSKFYDYQKVSNNSFALLLNKGEWYKLNVNGGSLDETTSQKT